MTADEMFENLGYAKDEGQGEYNIRYIKNDIGYEEIEFEIKEERVFFGEQTAIYMEHLQAINQKCKELGWLE